MTPEQLLQRRRAQTLQRSSFSAFCRMIGVKLYPGQQAVVRVAYDREGPADAAEAELVSQAYGAPVGPDVWRKFWTIVAMLCGRGSGKSYLGALRLLHLALTVPLTTLARGEIASGLIVAPDLRLARQTLRFAAGAMQDPLLRPFLVGEAGADKFIVQRLHDGQRVALECLPATGGGKAVRARSLVGAVLEEAAFFYSEGHVVNDTEIFEAITPRLLTGSQVIIQSTPWLRKGLIYSMWEQNTCAPSTALGIRAPTVFMRPEMADRVAELRRQDPDNALREYDAIALGAGAGVFFDPAALRLAVIDAEEVFVPKPGDEVIAAADFGFRVNASTLVIGYRRKDVTWIVEVIEIRPEPDLPLVPSEVVDLFAEILAKHRCHVVYCDAHGQERVQPYAVAKGISLFFVSTSDKTKFHLSAKVAFAQNQVRLPDHARLLKQLREIVGQPVGGGMISIKSPQWKTGEHGDLASACVLVIAATSGEAIVRTVDMSDSAERIRRDTNDYWQSEKNRIAESRSDELEDAFDPEAFGRIA